MCDLLNCATLPRRSGLIRRTSSPAADRKRAVVADTSVVNMLQESLTSPAGCLFPYRNITSGENRLRRAVGRAVAVLDRGPRHLPRRLGQATNPQPAHARRRHPGNGPAHGPHPGRGEPPPPQRRRPGPADRAPHRPHCRWTRGTWDGLKLRWNEIQNVPKHINELSNFLVRTHLAQADR